MVLSLLPRIIILQTLFLFRGAEYNEWIRVHGELSQRLVCTSQTSRMLAKLNIGYILFVTVQFRSPHFASVYYM